MGATGNWFKGKEHKFPPISPNTSETFILTEEGFKNWSAKVDRSETAIEQGCTA